MSARDVAGPTPTRRRAEAGRALLVAFVLVAGGGFVAGFALGAVLI